MKIVPEVQTTIKTLLGADQEKFHRWIKWKSASWQVVRFGIVGSLNTLIDVLALNLLLLYAPTHNAALLVIYNSIAYTLGTGNSYFLNRYWTFRSQQKATGSEILRFVLLSVAGIFCNDSLIWLTAGITHSLITNSWVWANTAKATAVVGTAVLSYFGMRLWVFTSSGARQSEVV